MVAVRIKCDLGDEDKSYVSAMTEEAEKKMDELEVTNEEEEDDVNPWDVRAKDEKGIDYDKLISKSLKISRFERPFLHHSQLGTVESGYSDTL